MLGGRESTSERKSNPDNSRVSVHAKFSVGNRQRRKKRKSSEKRMFRQRVTHDANTTLNCTGRGVLGRARFNTPPVKESN